MGRGTSRAYLGAFAYSSAPIRRASFHAGYAGERRPRRNARKVVVEIKSVERLAPVFEKQLQTYLRLTDCRAGLLINFNEALLKDGIKRVVNRLPETSPRAPLPRVPRVK